MKKNLILGAIRGYHFDKIKPFVHSLKASNYTGDLVLITNNIPQQTIDKIKENGYYFYDIDYRGVGALNSWSRFWPYLKPLASLSGQTFKRTVLKKILPLQTVRFFHYKDFLLKNRSKYENVLLTDVRDVYFQADPFNQVHTKIQCYEESGILGEEVQFNIPWIESLFGKNAADPFKHQKILCSGTILGPVDKMIEFINEFERLLGKAKEVGIGGSDQGLFNYLIRTYYNQYVNVVPNANGEVLTVPHNDNSCYRISGKNIYNLQQKLLPIIHQYDRSVEINSLVEEQYSTDQSH